MVLLVVADIFHIFVAPAGEIDDYDIVFAVSGGSFDCLGNGMARFQCRNDAFQTGKRIESIDRFVVVDNSVAGPFGIGKITVFRAYARVVKTG